jgi:hypothetical protein
MSRVAWREFNVNQRDQTEDAHHFDSLMKQVEAEADFMLMEPGEQKGSPEQQHKWLERIDEVVL